MNWTPACNAHGNMVIKTVKGTKDSQNKHVNVFLSGSVQMITKAI